MSKGLNEGLKVPSTFEDIKWKNSEVLADKDLLASNRKLIRDLLTVGSVIKAINNDSAENVPRVYNVDGIEVEFLPHWGFYRVGNFNLQQATSQEQILEDVKRVKEFQAYLDSREGSISRG